MDAVTALGAAKSVGDLVKSFTEALRKKNPDWTTVRTLAGAVQQAAYELQSENIGLQGQIGQLRLEIGLLKQQLASDEEWKARLAEVEEFPAPGGDVVLKKKGADIFYCPACREKRHLIPLQRRANGLYACPQCPSTGYQIQVRQATEIPVLQRRRPRNFS